MNNCRCRQTDLELLGQADLKVDDRSYYNRSAQAGGGQYNILIDELDLIVVTTGHDREMRPLRIMAQRILPAFIEQEFRYRQVKRPILIDWTNATIELETTSSVKYRRTRSSFYGCSSPSHLQLNIS